MFYYVYNVNILLLLIIFAVRNMCSNIKGVEELTDYRLCQEVGKNIFSDGEFLVECGWFRVGATNG